MLVRTGRDARASVGIMKPDSAEDASQELVAVRTFLSESEAEVAKGALTAFGIECLLSHDDCGGQRAHLEYGSRDTADGKER